MKLLFNFFLGFTLLAVITVALLWWNRVPIANYYLSKNLQAEATVQDISLGLDSFKIKNLVIQKPEIGLTLEAQNVALYFNLKNIISQSLIIDRVSITNSRLTSNIGDHILLKAPAFLTKQAEIVAKENEPAPDSITSEVLKKVLIKELLVTQLDIIVHNRLKEIKLNIPHIVLYNISSEGPGLGEAIMQNLLTPHHKKIDTKS